MKNTQVAIIIVNGVCKNVPKLLWEGSEHLSPNGLASIIMLKC